MRQIDQEIQAESIPSLCYRFRPEKNFTNIGEILRDKAHDSWISSFLQKNHSVVSSVSELSDYEYFRHVCEAFPCMSGTLIRQRDELLLSSVFHLTDIPSLESCDRIWSTCLHALRNESLNNNTITDNSCCYFLPIQKTEGNSLSEVEEEIHKNISDLKKSPRAVVIYDERMPAVFRRPDPYHAELAYKKFRNGNATPEESDIIYAQLLRTVAISCAESGVPLLLGNISGDFRSFYLYLYQLTRGLQLFVRINEVTYRFLDEASVFPVISDAVTMERIIPHMAIGNLIYLPDAWNTYSAGVDQLLFRKQFLGILPHVTQQKNNAETLFRAVCLTNFLDAISN